MNAKYQITFCGNQHRTQDAGKQDMKGYGSSLTKARRTQPVVWARWDNRADACSSSGNSWYRWEVSPGFYSNLHFIFHNAVSFHFFNYYSQAIALIVCYSTRNDIFLWRREGLHQTALALTSLSTGESRAALPGLAAQVERPLASTHSYCWQIGPLTTTAMAICTGLPGAY